MSSEYVPLDRHARDRVEDAIWQAWMDRYGYTIPIADFTWRMDLSGLLAIPEGVETLIINGTNISWLPRLPVSLTYFMANTCPLAEGSMNAILVQLDENGKQMGFADVTGCPMTPSGEGQAALWRLFTKGWMIMSF